MGDEILLQVVTEIPIQIDTTVSAETIVELIPQPAIDISLSELPKFGRVVQIKSCNDRTNIITGDKQPVFAIPLEYTGYTLTRVQAFVSTPSSSGNITVQIRNYLLDQDILTTPITIEEGEYLSKNATVQPVIHSSRNVFSSDDLLSIDIDSAGTGAKGLGVMLTFEI